MGLLIRSLKLLRNVGKKTQTHESVIIWGEKRGTFHRHSTEPLNILHLVAEHERNLQAVQIANAVLFPAVVQELHEWCKDVRRRLLNTLFVVD